MYSIEMFGRMLADDRRHAAMMAAIERLVKPGDTVIDIGTGFGFYALVAARQGAGKVYAIDPNPLVRLGPAVAAANGLEDRIEFIEDVSTSFDPPEPVDVILSDLRGTLPFYGQHLPSLRDARARLLKPGGAMIPAHDRIVASVSTNPTAAEYVHDLWCDGRFGFDLSPVADRAKDEFRRDRVSADQLLTKPIEIGSIDYNSIEATGLRFEGRAAVERAGHAHGLSVWFDATTVPASDGLPAIGYSTHPLSQPMIYGMAFLPFGPPVELEMGSEVDLDIRCDLVGDYEWTVRASGTDASGIPWQRAQSTFGADLFDAAVLAGHRASARVTSSDLLQSDLHILGRLARGATLGEAAASVAGEHPSIFPTTGSALDRVVDLAARYPR